MYRLTVTADKTGIDFDHIIWQWFRLTPHGQTPTTTIYSARSKQDLSQMQRDLLDGWVEEGDIISYECKLSEE